MSLPDNLADSMLSQRWLPLFLRCKKQLSPVFLAAGGTMALGPVLSIPLHGDDLHKTSGPEGMVGCTGAG